MRNKVTIIDYYKGFWSLYAFGAGIGILPPLVHELLGSASTNTKLFYPPLGDSQELAVALTIGFLLITTFVVFLCCRSIQRIRPIYSLVLLLGVFLGVLVLIFLYVNYVRVSRIESKEQSIPVSVGYARTEFAVATYHDASDWELLHDRGPWEDRIQTLWTKKSIFVVRFALWASYTLTLSLWLSIVSIAVYLHVCENDTAQLSAEVAMKS